MRKISILMLLLVCSVSWGFAAEPKLTERLEMSTTAFKELMATTDQSIPQDLLKDCEAVAIFPRTLNVAWGIGGQYGKGVLLRHDKKNHRWSAPAFYSLGGLTLGPQIGGQAIDIFLVVMNEKGLNSLLASKCTLGGDAGVALGPVGRNATASTDLKLKAEIYTYSRAKGLYIGLSLKGAIVSPDKTANLEYYGGSTTAREILLENQGKITKESGQLIRQLKRYTPGENLSLIQTLGLVVLALVIFVLGRALVSKMKGN